MSRYNLTINLSTVVKPPLCAFIILVAIDKRHWVMLLLLNLSAAFDNVDDDILLSRLHSKYSISGTALEWFRSYLTNRSQFALIEGCRSQFREFKCGVPQVSVLEPILYVVWSTRHHWTTFYDSMNCNFTFTPMTLNCKFLSLQITTWN